MNINSIANQINASALMGDINSDVTMSSDAKISMIEQSLLNGLDILNSLSVGSTVSGKVIMSDGENILLSLGQDKLLEAKVTADIMPKEGQMMTFLVNSSSTKSISLSPMFVNLNSDSNVSAALKNAGLPDNPKTQYMVSAMMEEGLPINKEALFEMNRAVNAFPEYDPKLLASMKRLDLPINDEMIRQFDKYLNYEHEITTALADVSDSFSESVSMLAENSTSEDLIAFVKNALPNLLGNESGSEPTADLDSKETNISIAERRDFVEPADLSSLSKNEHEIVNSLKNLGVSTENAVAFVSSSLGDKSKPTLFKDVVNNILGNLDRDIPKEEHEHIVRDLKNVFSSDIFKDSLKESFGNRFLLKPEEVADEKSVSSLYERLNQEIKAMTNSLGNTVSHNTPLGETVNNLNNNINFMNEINQTFNYVQIPLKLSNKDTSGELYVYSRRKSLAKEDGSVSALLHLDMDNLGPLDVHVMMNSEKNVKTKFYLKDDEALDLIAANIEILNERLKNRGYSMSSEFVNKSEDKTDDNSFFGNMINSSKNISVVSMNSFDAKA